MIFHTPLVKGRLIKRYKRFLADVALPTGEVVIAHTTNSGSMKSCIEPNAEVYLTPVNDPKRKTKFTWEMIEINGQWVGVNTAWPNVLVYEAIKNQEIENLKGYKQVKREVKYGDSRFDVYCENENEQCYVEVKNVTYKVGEKAIFPDAVTSRGQKHLKTLMEAKVKGYRAVMFYVIQRMDVSSFSPAKEIDPAYAGLLKNAVEEGVDVFAYQAKVSPTEIVLYKPLPIII